MRKNLTLTLAVGVLVACSPTPVAPGTATDATTAASASADAAPRAMPPLSPDLASMQDFYRFQFLPDGYPGRLDDDGTVFAHPIYGTYVLGDYVRQYEAEPTQELRDAISTVAHAAVSRMDEHEGALVFWYDVDVERASRLYERHYSGLTQAYYAVRLHRAGIAIDDPELVEAAAEVFDSLLVPAEDGGVYFESSRGISIAEVPQAPNSWILNGWQSALASMDEYADMTGSPEAREVVDRSATTMAEMLPLYEVPELRTSRYGLTGFTYLRLSFESAPARLSEIELEVPGEGEFAFAESEGISRWQLYPLDEDLEDGRPTSSSVRLNAVLSLASSPEPNRLHFTVEGAEGEVVVEVQTGRFDPLVSAPVDTSWERLASVPLDGRQQDVVVDIDPSTVAAVVAPTNFTKEIDGQNVNVYHSIHVQRLRQLGLATGVDQLDETADRWSAYVCDWATMDVYDGLSVRGAQDSDVGSPEAWCP